MSQSKDFMIEDGVLLAYNGSGGDVVIPDHVVTIDSGVFAYCADLVSVTLPKGLQCIGQEAFWGCVNLKEVKVSKKRNTDCAKCP